MITDEQRRRVAKRMYDAADGTVYKGNSFCAMLARMTRTKKATRRDVIHRLADLIDRPTCHLELTDVETHGNTKVRIYECSECGRSCEEIYGKYDRCPHCGAVVVDAD